jgi:hypothetical protein
MRIVPDWLLFRSLRAPKIGPDVGRRTRDFRCRASAAKAAAAKKHSIVVVHGVVLRLAQPFPNKRC